MVEIARAFTVTDMPVRLVILDEPTSSLDAVVAGQLLAFVRRFVAGGGACILISHLLGEILAASDRIVVMRDGRVVASRAAGEFTRDSLVAAMGNVAEAGQERSETAELARDHRGRPRIRARRRGSRTVRSWRPIGRGRGARRARRPGPERDAAGAVRRGAAPDGRGGDRRQRRAGGRRPADRRHLPALVDRPEHHRRLLAGADPAGPGRCRGGGRARRGWRERIGIRTPDVGNNILSLSGGNQQKALFARALGSDAEIVLMDDPMRGVDVGTKQEVYAMIRAEAEAGRTFVWYTTEMDELQHCDHVYVFRDGRIVADLPRAMAPRRRCCTPRSRSRREVGDPLPPHLARGAAGPVPGRAAGRHLLAAAAHDELCRPQPDAQPGDPDRARDHRPDVRDHRQRPRPRHRHLCRLRRLRRRHLAGRDAAPGHRGAGRRHPGLRRPGRADPSAQPALDRGHARHVVRLAGPVGADPADARRQGAGMGALADDAEAALCALPDHRRRGDRAPGACAADAHLLRRRPARRRRQPQGDRARRLVAADRAGWSCSPRPASSACWPAWR